MANKSSRTITASDVETAIRVSTAKAGLTIHTQYQDGDGILPLLKAIAPAKREGAASNQDSRGEHAGMVDHPVDYAKLRQLRTANIHHSRCITAKVQATTGFGHKSADVDKKLDPLCDSSWFETLMEMGNDLEDCYVAYLEVKRDGNGKVIGIYHIPSTNVYVEREEGGIFYHYRVSKHSGFSTVSDSDKYFARYKERPRLRKWMAQRRINLQTQGKATEVSEIIRFRVPNSLSRYYGVPTWLSVLPSIDTIQVSDQFAYDFFQNFGAVSQLLTFVGDTIDDADWKLIVQSFQETLRTGGHKGMVLNLPSQTMRVEKLDLAGSFAPTGIMEFDRNKVVDIMAGHGVPYSIAGVAPSGKVVFSKSGETRETLQLFQALEIEGKQRMIAKVLERTLGQESGLRIADEDKVSQEISGVTQEMKIDKISGWTLATVMDVIEFEMTPQLGGPKPADGSSDNAKAGNKSASGSSKK
jgi:hypothetical protein